MSLADQRLALFIDPVYSGQINTQRGLKAFCFGWCTDRDSKLVAALVMGAETSVNAIRASIHAGETLWMRTGEYGNSTPGYTDGKYSVYITAIPDSGKVSGLILNKTLEGFDREHRCCYLPLIDQEDLYDRLHQRLNDICDIAVLRSWIPHLYTHGLEIGLALPLLRGESRSTHGFRIVQILNKKHGNEEHPGWTEIIQSGLASGKIKIQNGSENGATHV